jgi:hypothetical protein
MGYNARNDEIRDNVTRTRREWEAQRDALATVRPAASGAATPEADAAAAWHLEL